MKKPARGLENNKHGNLQHYSTFIGCCDCEWYAQVAKETQRAGKRMRSKEAGYCGTGGGSVA